jgi:hypothetical protein
MLLGVSRGLVRMRCLLREIVQPHVQCRRLVGIIGVLKSDDYVPQSHCERVLGVHGVCIGVRTVSSSSR